jgi:hypothetical protein
MVVQVSDGADFWQQHEQELHQQWIEQAQAAARDSGNSRNSNEADRVSTGQGAEGVRPGAQDEHQPALQNEVCGPVGVH